MSGDVLSLNSLSFELLAQLSYQPLLGLSPKRVLRRFEWEALIAELVSMTERLNEQIVSSEIALDHRIKSYASIVEKYERYLNSSAMCARCFMIFGLSGFL